MRLAWESLQVRRLRDFSAAVALISQMEYERPIQPERLVRVALAHAPIYIVQANLESLGEEFHYHMAREHLETISKNRRY